MVFRLPSQLESLVPPPFNQRTQPPPWRGSIVVSGMRSSDRSSNQEIFVTAVETDGENRAQKWPSTFYVRVLHDQPVLGEFRNWMKTYIPPLPLCTFMPNRLRDVNLNTVNHTNFRSLSTFLYENQVIAVASWAPDTFHGAGMIIYPSSNSSAVLIGALFFDTSFPSFIGYAPPSMSPISPLAMQPPPRHSQYPQQRIVAVPPYEGSSPHRHAPSLSPHRSDHNSPIEQPIAAHRQDPYHRYIMPRPGYPELAEGSTSSQIGWTGNVKAEDENNYANYSTSHQNPPYS
ncbi:hypothetical protein BDN70DRAFT_807833 [Pholiota conissans]|uniref:Uncharacterized protein n=1 Tax=Pholiota conissans TaxID=109636 RepID=A0A9P6CT48_9AGAR|nr:hypothetical protein BDN70DRAFT_807833 [Pholiota conissans]